MRKHTLGRGLALQHLAGAEEIYQVAAEGIQHQQPGNREYRHAGDNGDEFLVSRFHSDSA
jgi:hypothetical protein